MAIPSAVYRLCSSSIMKLMLAPNLQVSKEVEKCAHLWKTKIGLFCKKCKAFESWKPVSYSYSHTSLRIKPKLVQNERRFCCYFLIIPKKSSSCEEAHR